MRKTPQSSGGNASVGQRFGGGERAASSVSIGLLVAATALALGCSSSGDDSGSNASAGANASAGTSNGGSGNGGSGNGGVGNAGAGTSGGAAGTVGQGGDLPVLAYNPCDVADLVGSFRIQRALEYTGISGSVRNGTVPGDVPDVVMQSGECSLLTKPALFCDPPCGSGTTCSGDGSCIAYPTSQDVGTVTIEGLKVETVIEPSTTGFYTNPAQPALPHPGFEEGAAITLHAQGGVLEPFTLQGLGTTALELSSEELSVSADQPLSVSWTVADEPDEQRVLLKLEFNRHGGTPTWIECHAPDTGSFEIPAELVSELLALEISGWPMLTATRRTTDSAELSVGCVELQVYSEVTEFVEVEGIVSCDDQTPCPNDAPCTDNLVCP